MSTTSNLKEQARAFELREQWRSALEVYEKLVKSPPEGEDLDVGIWNRIGDLYMRLAEPGRAVEAYEQAVQAYEDVGLHNNALALCGKILRISPGRSATYLKLGLISALKGFGADAQAHLQRYVDGMTRLDQQEQALVTIAQNARSHAAEAGVFQVLVERLRLHGWGGRIEDELAPEYDRLVEEGLIEEADQLRAILDGESVPPSVGRSAPGASASLAARLRDPSEGRSERDEDQLLELIEPAKQYPAADDALNDAQAGDEPSTDLGLVEISPLDGLQSTPVSERDKDLQPADLASDADTDLLADLQLSPGEDAALEDIEELDDASAEDLPLITFEPELDVASLDVITVRDVVDIPVDLSAIEPPSGFDSPDLGLVEDDELDDLSDGDDLPLLEISSFDRPDLHASPGDDYDRGEDGDSQDAEAHDLPLMDLASEAMLDTEPSPSAPSAQSDAAAVDVPEPAPDDSGADDGFIDLAALIFEDDEPATTRFVVDAEEPTGDEDKDFAEMLVRFREEVAKNIDADDNSSHYDLGVAFKEMGLIDDAISEFQSALRAGSNPVATMEMLGTCFIEKSQHAVAWRVLDQAVRLSGSADAELVGVLYWLGRCDEALGRTDAACECYERVLSVDIRFRDSASRLEALRS